jgi:hypothetical protein
MKNIKRIFVGGAVLMLSFGFVSTLSASESEPGEGDDGATTVVCSCKGMGKCVTNGDGGGQCNASNKCADYNSNCG